MSDSFIFLIGNNFRPFRKDRFIKTFFLQKHEMQLSRSSKIQYLAFIKICSLYFSLYIGSVIKCFLKTLFLMIRISPVTISLPCTSVKGELLYLHGKLCGFVKNTYKSRTLTRLSKLKSLLDKHEVSF